KELSDEQRATQLTLPGDQHPGGTPAFMAPEQVRGNMATDESSDIYAVGCVAYWLITGQLVFTGRTVIDVMLQHAEASPVPPSQRTELPIPEALDRLILDCLAKNPSDRPSTADALAARLAAIEPTRLWSMDRQRQWWDAHHPVVTEKSHLGSNERRVT